MTDLVARTEIADLVSRYALAADRRDHDALLSCFAENGVLETADARFDGIAAIRAMLAGMPPNGGTTHLSGNVLVTFANEDEASIDSATVVFVMSADRATMTIRGVNYRDLVRRTDAGWRIVHRVHSLAWQRGPEAI